MIKKLFRFGISGASAALINLLLFYVFESILNINYALAVIISTVCSASYHFMIQKKWVFNVGDSGSTKTEGYLFFIASVINLVLNEMLLVMFITVLNLDPFWSQLISLGLLACMNFFLYEHIVFVRRSAVGNSMHAYFDCIKVRHALLVLGFVIWTALHYWGVIYGTQHIPLHQSYVGDEQSPVNGALHVLDERSPLGLRNLKTLYYGPVFAMLAVPAVGIDFVTSYIGGEINSVADYHTHVLFDWGGIIRWARVFAVLAGVLGIIAAYGIGRTKLFNPQRNAYIPFLLASALAVNFYYFEYSHFFKHWIFIVSMLMWQIYGAVCITEAQEKKKRIKWWVVQALLIALGFGISYTNLAFQLFWIGFGIYWFREKKYLYKEWIFSMIGAGIGILIMFVWHPYAFIRLLKGGAFKPFEGQNVYGFGYYAHLLIVNHLSLILAVIVSTAALVYKKLLSRETVLWVVALGLIILPEYYMFSSQYGLNREGRYMLPVIVAGIMLSVYIIAQAYERCAIYRLWKLTIILLVACYFAFHAVHDVRWMYVFAKGPTEQQLIQKALELQEGEEKILLVQNYIAGHAHTKESYQDYVSRYGKSEVNLYKAILAAELPKDRELLNAYYRQTREFKISDIELFDHAFIVHEPRREINQFDFFDEDIIRLWFHKDLSPSFMIIK